MGGKINPIDRSNCMPGSVKDLAFDTAIRGTNTAADRIYPRIEPATPTSTG